MDSQSAEPPVWTVSQLNRRVAGLLDEALGRLWVRGEVSGLTRAASGHCYFSIKDAQSAVRAVAFRGRVQRFEHLLVNGALCEFSVRPGLYEPRGDFQVQVDALRPAGRGDLHAAFERLKAQLTAEGLFDTDRKRAPVDVPAAIGVVTSLEAAALRDVLTALRRRAPHVRVIVYPTLVQGEAAVPRLCEALAQAGRRQEVDTLLLVRGGGSLEDLWCFNDAEVVRAVAASPMPVITGVGHETDTTLVDFAADVRAPTPTAAAELCCVERGVLQGRLAAAHGALQAQWQRKLERAALRLDRASAGLVSPQQRLQAQGDRLSQWAARLQHAADGHHERAVRRLDEQVRALGRCLPDLTARRHGVVDQAHRLSQAWAQQHRQADHRLQSLAQRLDALGPRQVLSRGYALVRDEHGRPVTSAAQVQAEQRLRIDWAQGTAQVRVEQADGAA